MVEREIQKGKIKNGSREIGGGEKHQKTSVSELGIHTPFPTRSQLFSHHLRLVAANVPHRRQKYAWMSDSHRRLCGQDERTG